MSETIDRANRKIVEWAESEGMLNATLENPKVRAISLGAGVQSTCMALMAAHGEIGPMPDCAIFADTGAEPQGVYDHLDWLMSANVLPFPVHVVNNGNLRDKIGQVRPKGKWAHQPIPAFIKNANGIGPANRDCTRDFKIVPILRESKRLAGITNKKAPDHPIVEQWIGISTDEAGRAKPSRHAWTQHRFPLLEEGMSRQDCLAWMRDKDYPTPPKSSCTFCPYHSNTMWRDLRDNDPESWADAVEVDGRIRDIWGDEKKWFLHRTGVPLDEVDLSTAEDHGQLNFFINECEGMCGV
jgi:hypothetical protein